MLNKEDELRLEFIIEELGTEQLLSVSDQRWVVSKLKEINEELKNHENKNRCYCTGLSHTNTCQYWVLPL